MGNMRLKTEIIIAAELKYAQNLGLFATIIRRGDQSAGQIYLMINSNNLQYILIGPPFGASFDDGGQKIWSYPLGQQPMTEKHVNDYLQKIQKFDPDIYILEIEDKSLEYRPQGVFVIDEVGAITVDKEDESANAKQLAENLFKGAK